MTELAHLPVFVVVVLGAVLLALHSLSRLARRAGETSSSDPYSIDQPDPAGTEAR